MRLIEALDSFASENPGPAETRESIILLKSYLATIPRNGACRLTAESLYQFLGNFYLTRYVSGGEGEQLPAPSEIVTALGQLLDWMAGRQDMIGELLADAHSALSELAVTLPQAVYTSRQLAECLSKRQGPFAFSEFLTTFEDGGQSQYEPDVAGRPRTKEGYFRITRADGKIVEARESLSEEAVWPILLPEGAEGILSPGYIVNLDIVRNGEYWEITGCGLAYPPGTIVP